MEAATELDAEEIQSSFEERVNDLDNPDEDIR
jgi:hypothetical protein